jgi:hypothetical protein
VTVGNLAPMRDLSDPRWIKAKGVLFLVLGLATSAVLILEHPSWRFIALLALAVWSFCRAYYFAFYVIEHYVDPEFRFSGLLSFGRYFFRRRPPPSI